MRVKFPWERLEPGQGFFVPCLHFEPIKEMGLRSAVPFRYKVDVVPGIKGGRLGLWFIRRK